MTWKMSQDDARREGRYEGKLEGKLEGEFETRCKTVLNMRRKGLTDAEIVDLTGYPPEVVANVPKAGK